MKKIGILTFHASHNNGSMLQALALQKILEKYFDNVEIINYSNKSQRNMYSIVPLFDYSLKSFIIFFLLLINFKILKRQFWDYENFKKNYFKLSLKEFTYIEKLKNYINNYKTVIFGSDQIWNNKCFDHDDVYFGYNLDIKYKYAYAVSFGANNPFLDNKYIDYVKDFRRISVRENNGRKWIKSYLNIDVDICLDPTLLFNSNEWENLTNIGDRLIKEEYIFCYTFDLGFKTQRFLYNISNKYNLPVYIIDPRKYILKFCWKNNIKLINRFGPSVFLNLIKYAKIIFTSSFHGTVFSTIFHKCFWYVKNEKYVSLNDDRATTLINQLQLSDRYRSIEELGNINLLEEHDYKISDSKLFELQESSLNYIEKIKEDIDNG